MNLNDLYKKVSVIPIGDFPPSALSGLLHGYISIYSIVRVNPWLEDVYGSQWDIHERIREIAGELADLIQDPSIALEDRVGYIADLMETYLTYSDMDFLDIALDAAYGIISPEGRDEIVLPCRTPEMCRLLCSCYYFTGEEECGLLAGSLVTETLGLSRITSLEELVAWWNAIGFYESVVGKMEAPVEEQRRMTEECVRWAVRVQQWENEITKCNLGALESLINLFYVLAKQSCTEK